MAAQAQFSTVQRGSFALSLNGGAAALAAGMMAPRIAPVSGSAPAPKS